MKNRIARRSVELRGHFICCALAFACIGSAGQSTAVEPIAYVGHGALFDAGGNEIAPTPDFIKSAQAWYRANLIAALGKSERTQFAALERARPPGAGPDSPERQVGDARLLVWLVDHAKTLDAQRMRGKVLALNRALLAPLVQPAVVDPVFERKLGPASLPHPRPVTTHLLVTNTRGDDYRQACSDHGVPLPVDFGPGSPWQARDIPGNPDGIIAAADLFIARGDRAQVLTLLSTTPAGMCVALPRFTASNLVKADGVICFGQNDPLEPTRPKACFWDNQNPSDNVTGTFTFQRGAAQSISQFAGGSDLRGGVGGVCSDCHSGENPYVIHGPVLSSLANAVGTLPALPTFASAWYDPIVRTGDTVVWPQNPGPMNAPASCVSCHGTALARGYAGRLPHLSTALPGYCGSVLRAAVGAKAPQPFPLPVGQPATTPPPSMPLGSPGGMSCTPDMAASDVRHVTCTPAMTMPCNATFAPTDVRLGDPVYNLRCTPELGALLSWCGAASSGDASARGDPHVHTIGGIPYDFQGAGEFVLLRGGPDLEVQTRQTPVSTAAPYGPDPQTGLTSCVSVTTAMAARVGTRRVSLEPGLDGDENAKGLTLRVDGKPVKLGARGIALGAGARVTRSALGGSIEITFPDNSRLTATPGFWGPPNNVWYLNVDVVNTPSHEGVMGGIVPGDWLPLLPDGLSLGGRPASLAARFVDLNQRFADAWRVTDASSLFDYAPGTSTATFTRADWPPEKASCVIADSKVPPAQPMDPEKAAAVCRSVVDKDLKEQCIFDVTATGQAGFAATYLVTQQLRHRHLRRPPILVRPVVLGQH